MQSSCAHHVSHYTVQALRARGKRAVVLPHAFGLLPTILSRRSVGGISMVACSRLTQSSYLTLSGFFRRRTLPRGFVAVVLGRFRQAPKKAVAPLELFDGRRELRHAAADTVLKKVDKAPSYDDTWSAVVVRTQRIQQSLPKVEKQNTSSVPPYI